MAKKATRKPSKKKAAPKELTPALKEKPGVLDHDNPYTKHPPEVIERALWAIAANGGNVSKAQRELEAEGTVGPNGKAIPHATLSYWKQRSHRNRYHEIKVNGVEELERVIAQDATDLAIELADAERVALRQTLAGLTNANGAEAAQILRNLSQSKQVQEQTLSRLQARGIAQRSEQSLREIAEELRRLSPAIVAIKDEAPTVDAEVVELLGEGEQGPAD